MVKAINREANDAIQPSFLLEVMGHGLVLEPFGRYRDEIRFFLASAVDRIVDDWPDPAGLGPSVNAGIRTSRRQALTSVVRGWLAIAEEALLLETDGKERAAVDKWENSSVGGCHCRSIHQIFHVFNANELGVSSTKWTTASPLVRIRLRTFVCSQHSEVCTRVRRGSVLSRLS